MGAVEAALYDKPVIIAEYGAPPEYIKTPYTISCGRQEIACDDFLFQKGMVWGKPDFDKLMEYMKHAYDNKVLKQDHTMTRELVSAKKIREEFGTVFN